MESQSSFNLDSASSAESTPAATPWLTKGYAVLLAKLKTSRENRGLSIETLADRLGLPVPLVEKYENGELPLDVLQTRTWVSALDVPLAVFTQELDDELCSTLDRDEVIVGEVAPDTIGEVTPTMAEVSGDDEEDEDPPKEARIEILLFVPGEEPVVRVVDNRLEVFQELVGNGLITTFPTGIQGTIGIANDEGILLGMEVNVVVPGTGAVIVGPAVIAADAAPNFGSITPLMVEQALDAFAVHLSQEAFSAIVRSHRDGHAWQSD